ncbi:uncharacterized protein LOC116606770 isoform X3 [Nematostella vectensis]|uniref:uncharacterized protein LOC116606147 isoform X3 n=1 Tax=Nematostella vectensis TaxID=45351 RepID=UPI0020772255|nr:uncharacterized protein LOC116606147 isoform X3 [Nematostella vectensis]XP_048588154.1 uncharacterized protein LOC116606770 isoform X3 [Nematostella vectensis]
MAPKSRGKRKKSVEELLKEGRNLLDRQEVKSKRKRKPVRFLFSTDPATGLRNNKGTYKGQKKSKEKRLNPEFDVSGEETEETAEHCIPNDGENADLSGKSIPTKDEVYCPECNHKCCIAGFLESHIFVVTMKGRFDLNNLRYVCTSCDKTWGGNHPIILVQLGFWPGSITGACYAFDDSLFVYWDMLQKQVPGISERAFLKSLEEFSKCRGRVGTVNPQTFRTAFREWKYCQFEIDKIRQLDWMTCPACDDLPHSMHVDGNMKLYRFASAGKRKADSYYGEAFIANNVKVDAHLQNVYQCPTKKVYTTNLNIGDDHYKCSNGVLVSVHCFSYNLRLTKVLYWLDSVKVLLSNCSISVLLYSRDIMVGSRILREYSFSSLFPTLNRKNRKPKPGSRAKLLPISNRG